MSAQYVFDLTVQLGCPLPVRDNLNKYVYSTTRIGNIWYMNPKPAHAEFVYAVLYRLTLFLSEITVVSQLTLFTCIFKVRENTENVLSTWTR